MRWHEKWDEIFQSAKQTLQKLFGNIDEFIFCKTWFKILWDILKQWENIKGTKIIILFLFFTLNRMLLAKISLQFKSFSFSL